MRNSVILQVDNLHKTYHDFTLKNINFEIKQGEIVGLVGANGAGKSTIIKAIIDLIKIDSGVVKVFDLNHRDKGEEIKERIGFVFDDNHFPDNLKLRDVKKILKMIYKNWDNDIFIKYLKEFTLNENKKIKELSKGMKTKFFIAVALSHNAEFLIMDEPTSGLDPMVRDEILDIIYDLTRNRKVSILFSTHITTDLEKIANRIIFVHQGEVIQDCLMDDLLSKYIIVKCSYANLSSLNYIGIRRYPEYCNALILSNELSMIGDCETKTPTLEDIILYHIKKEKNYV